MAANEKWVVPASHDERRYAVGNVNECYKKNWNYFGPLLSEIAAGEGQGEEGRMALRLMR